MFRIAICDDEKVFSDKLNKMIKTICDQNNIDYKSDVYFDGLSLIENYEKYHLIFLDIEMPLIDGISVAEHLNNKRTNDIPYVVFVTGRDNLVFKALRSYPYSFIRKNDLEEDLSECIVKVSNKIKANNNTITIHSGRSDIIIDTDDIIYLEKNKNYVVYHTVNQDYTVRSTIDQEHQKLKGYGFLRSHIGFVVNNEFVVSLSADRIKLKSDISIPINKKYKSVREDYFKWLGEKYV
jgi:DNA-binding LytR/AlgR family response regulator